MFLNKKKKHGHTPHKTPHLHFQTRFPPIPFPKAPISVKCATFHPVAHVENLGNHPLLLFPSHYTHAMDYLVLKFFFFMSNYLYFQVGQKYTGSRKYQIVN